MGQHMMLTHENDHVAYTTFSASTIFTFELAPCTSAILLFFYIAPSMCVVRSRRNWQFIFHSYSKQPIVALLIRYSDIPSFPIQFGCGTTCCANSRVRLLFSAFRRQVAGLVPAVAIARLLEQPVIHKHVSVSFQRLHLGWQIVPLFIEDEVPLKRESNVSAPPKPWQVLSHVASSSVPRLFWCFLSSLRACCIACVCISLFHFSPGPGRDLSA